MPLPRFLRLSLAVFAVVSAASAFADERAITLASTTSTEQSGLFGHILPIFQADTGVSVHVVAVGTGQALAIGERGDADALLVHDRAGEDRFIAKGFGIDRRDVMFNDFILVGPKDDPAKIAGLRDAAEALRRIAAAKAPFASRGDDSGTDRMERRLWKTAGLAVPQGADWYRELGSGMGQTLNTAEGLGAYTLADRGTWASFKNRRSLTLLVEGDPILRNSYGAIRVDPAKRPQEKGADALVWQDWLTGPKGQAAIASYKIGGEQLFFLPQDSGSR